MFKDAWGQRQAQADVGRAILRKDRDAVDRKIEGLLDRIVDTDNTSLVATYEKRLEKLDREKLVLDEKLENHGPKPGTFEELFEHPLDFLSSPWKLWESGSLNLRRTVLKLAFADRMTYSRKEGLRTPKTTTPFKALEGFCGDGCKMAERQGFEPWVGLHPQRFSRPPRSTTPAPLRGGLERACNRL